MRRASVLVLVAAMALPTACAGSTLMPGLYVKVQASASFTPIFNSSLFNYPSAVNVTSVVRIK